MQRTTPSSSSSSSAAASSRDVRRRRTARLDRPLLATRLRLLSATYGPAEGRQDAITGALVDYAKKETHVPYTRDVLPFLKALLSLSLLDGEDETGAADGKDENGCEEGATGEAFVNVRQEGEEAEEGQGDFHNDRPQTIQNHRTHRTNSFPLMDGRPMNAVFGDPCPGVTKVLRVEYSFRDYYGYHDAEEAGDEAVDAAAGEKECDLDEGCHATTKRTRRRRRCRCAASRKCRSTFREHERVLLKRRDPWFRPATADDDEGEPPHATEARQQRQRKRSTEGREAEKGDGGAGPSGHAAAGSLSSSAPSPASPSPAGTQQWRLAPTISEITLPIVLPFLTIRRRATCQMVCRSWKEIVLEHGITNFIDVNDLGLFPRWLPTDNNTHSRSSDGSPPMQNHILRSLLNHSHSSLEALVLNDFTSLNPIIDLHPALPYLRKLRYLDISRIPSITDDTLHLISSSIGERLEVLYMKGLRQITNDGVIRLVQSCVNMRVLNVSQVCQLDDTAGMAIGTHLTKLEVFHAEDNHRLTNKSVDLITMNCSLLQSNFWGCIRLTSVRFIDADPQPAHENDVGARSGKIGAMPPTLAPALPRPSTHRLILLNLWGCHNLTDGAARQLIHLPHLRSLCVSECHRLTDRFVAGIAVPPSVLGPRLMHLQLRYLKRITDASLECIAQRMTCLYSLDVSFCTKLSVRGVARLLTERCATLAEVRLYSCRQLDVEGGGGSLTMNRVGGGDGRTNVRAGSNGRQFVRALRSTGLGANTTAGILSLLDLRECQQHEPFVRDEIFLNGMADLGFDEALPGLFIRPAGWNDAVRRQLVANLSEDDAGGRHIPQRFVDISGSDSKILGR